MSSQLLPEDSSQPNALHSRFSGIHLNVRSFLGTARSSIYSTSNTATAQNTPKPSRFSFRYRSRGSPELPQWNVPSVTPSPSASTAFPQEPLFPQHTAGSYQREISQSNLGIQDETFPQEPEQVVTRGDSAYGAVDPETAQLASMVQEQRSRNHRKKKSKRRRKQRHQGAWVRRRSDKGSLLKSIKSPAAKGKLLACLISATFLALVLTTYLCIALLRPSIGQEIHVLFILVIICITIFFCHSLIRLCMQAHQPQRRGRPSVANMTDPEGFRPVRPIRVRLARDDELSDIGESAETSSENSSQHELAKEKVIAPPPPAYGLWRSSVRVDPNLLHWQKVEESRPISSPNSELETEAPFTTQPGPRPPSYVSEDGVSYVFDGGPRSVVPPSSSMSDVHPAYRY